ncbi:MAG: zinc metallopeptidase [Bacteroidales bacterium]|nr:zinc metallopeptidase [Bacteroidales bacterium]MCR5191749.1 zinc metallopeptidase [Bacteroidales bacterium]
MDLSGRRKSTNVEDRRSSGGKIAGLGIGGALIAALIALFMGGNPSQVSEVIQQLGGQNANTEQYVPTAEEEQLKDFAEKILASTEDVWEAQFKKMGKTYKAPKMVLFHGSVQSGCGNASSAMGPFYCSADECVYLDLDFFNEMPKSLGAGGDFAYAYVIAHEVGHHVEHLLGILDEAHSNMSRVSETEKNKISVRIELLADFYAGVWGYHENKMFGSLEDGDLEEAINAAQKIGDDYLQKNARGYATPESFTHGTSAQRVKWLKKGLTSGNMAQGDTFSIPYSSL